MAYREAYFEEEQQGQERADYGVFLIKELSRQLIEEFGKGFDERELRRMRQFYQTFSIRDALRPELSWTHYRIILRVDNPTARQYYITETAEQSWSTRQLERNINTLYYERLLSTQSKREALLDQEKMEKSSSFDVIKNPYVLEFLGLENPVGYSESDVESAIISNLQAFLLEMGKGFSFVGRQYRIKTDTKVFYIDMVFYNYILKCFVLVDLKINELTHQDIGQMDMYVRMFEDLKKTEGDNPTIGIIFCAEKDHTLVKYSMLEENKQLFASKYRLVLPTEEELRVELEREKQFIREQIERKG
ncbi:PDDEXK nuclease domain-containing protein [Chitinophaga sp. RAB17]|uniref:PDDEXK nuclease domain-containing protein n=1 Tax=Chitinophaga sp. RAB17 TaxID=3233049 RepID=UPI003F93AD73